jgi:hypothetical protein
VLLGLVPLWTDARQLMELSYQHPPRETRLEPVAGPVGLFCGLLE